MNSRRLHLWRAILNYLLLRLIDENNTSTQRLHTLPHSETFQRNERAFMDLI